MMKSVLLLLLSVSNLGWLAASQSLDNALQEDDQCQGEDCSLQLLQSASLRGLANATEGTGCPTCQRNCYELREDKFACTDPQTLLGTKCYIDRIAKACPKTCGCCKTCSICKIPTSCY
eukprot:symbB.v1.2.031299.t1/scaffold3551.1/size54235/2